MSWEQVKGHDHLIEGFRRVVARGRLAHGYLFTGPVGVGKSLFARELARALLCEQSRGELQACETCPSCVQLTAGTHPDFREAVKPAEALEFPIELMREVCASFALKPARGKGKVVLIDDADDLNEESANCFLKTLEEPPAQSVIILIGTSPERQLPTIVSRCQQVRFAPLREELVREILVAQGVTDPGQRERLSRLSRGSPGVALTLAAPELWEMRGKLLAGLTRKPVDAVELSKAWMAFLEGAGKEAAARRAWASQVLRLVLDFLNDALVVATGGQPRRTGEEDAKALHALASRMDAEQLLELLDRCLEADFQIVRRVQLELVLESLLDGLAQRLAV